ncbi:MAG: hypothetical protein EHM40_07695 [Chloroflexi bacterium]|nr:MAG: hypothetical protein EHM40_07695 [Chloroflexota bacterium]
MGKKLYHVKVVLYVMAENESEARVAATNARFDIFECTAKKARNVELGWNNSIPYNADDDRTCAEILVSQPQSMGPVNPSPTAVKQRRPGKWIITNVPYVNR